VTIDLPPWAVQKLVQLQQQMSARDGTAPPLAELALRAVTSGIETLLEPEHDRPLRELSVGQFAKLVGIPDVRAARANAEQTKHESEKAAALVRRLLDDSDGLLKVATCVRFTSPTEVTSCAEDLARALVTGNGKRAVVLAAAVIDENGHYRPLGAGGAN
jgi:hypothetical protein